MSKANQSSRFDDFFQSASQEPQSVFSEPPPEQSKKSKSTSPEYKRTTIYLRKALHRKLKATAADQDREMSEIIEEMVENYLKFRCRSKSLD